jgi:hypothetical protein
MSVQFKEILELAALSLSIVNALILINQYLRDRAVLKVKPVHPEEYQWWFRLPKHEKGGKTIRGYGLLVYVGIGNRGLRNVALESWRLYITGTNGHKQELKALSIPEPTFSITFPNGETYNKTFQVLGTAGVYSKGETAVDSGYSISGWAYYIVEYVENDTNDLAIKNGRVTGTFVVKDIFGGMAKTKITFSEIDFDRAKSLVKGLEVIR